EVDAVGEEELVVVVARGPEIDRRAAEGGGGRWARCQRGRGGGEVDQRDPRVPGGGGDDGVVPPDRVRDRGDQRLALRGGHRLPGDRHESDVGERGADDIHARAGREEGVDGRGEVPVHLRLDLGD